ncbi:dual specificity protein phosphatase 6 [Platysternon megacephalum]|uniref:Dual specificity protein phosphatase 6 n=1 Tax=Platysternon megacephalum TaxID=55544 RepID=A0A4D9EE05_9SAUR|nr:dual specificity protein phosphatase 6 [Platysternon megacephalum]
MQQPWDQGSFHEREVLSPLEQEHWLLGPVYSVGYTSPLTLLRSLPVGCPRPAAGLGEAGAPCAVCKPGCPSPFRPATEGSCPDAPAWLLPALSGVTRAQRGRLRVGLLHTAGLIRPRPTPVSTAVLGRAALTSPKRESDTENPDRAPQGWEGEKEEGV